MFENNEDHTRDRLKRLKTRLSIVGAVGGLGVAVFAGVNIAANDEHSPKDALASITFDESVIARVDKNDVGIGIAGLGGLVVGGLLTSSIIPGHRESKE